MPTENDRAAEWLKSVLERHGITSSRQAEIRTNGTVTYGTIWNMLKGRRPSEGVIVKIAHAFGEDVGDALRACGYEDVADMLEVSGRTGGASSGRNELKYETADEEEILSFYRGTAPDLQPAAKATLKALLEESRRRRNTAIGRRIDDDTP